MKRYANGYDSPVFRIHYPTGVKTVEMSFEYSALIEYEEDITTLDRFTDGSKEATTHFYDYEWRLIYADEINLDERLKIKEIQDALKNKIPVELTPHKDYPWRYFFIIINPEKRSLETEPDFGGLDDTTNFGFEISFLNRDTINNISIINPNHLPIMAAESCQEF